MKELTKNFDCYHILKSDMCLCSSVTALGNSSTVTPSIWCAVVSYLCCTHSGSWPCNLCWRLICVNTAWMALFCLYLYFVCFCLSGEDVWSYAKGLPHMFQQGGVFYNIMKKTMGIVKLWFYLGIMFLFKVYKIKSI